MTFDEYQQQAMSTALKPVRNLESLTYRTLGLVGEAGEVAEKIKKILRDKDGQLDDSDRQELVKELGDVLWYLQAIANWLEIPFQQIATGNLEKVLSRKARGKTGGSGDNR